MNTHRRRASFVAWYDSRGMAPFVCVLLATLASVFSLAGSTPVRAECFAGAARSDITPDVAASKIPLGGYAARRAAPAIGVHDPIYARALVLKQGDTKVGIVSVDLCFLPANVKVEVVKRVAAAGVTGLDSGHLFLCATHTHTAPDPLAMHSGNHFTLAGWTAFNQNLLDFTSTRIARAVIDAEKRLVPAVIGSATIDATGLNRNRRGHTTTDPAMTLIKVNDRDGKAIGAVVNFASHPTLWDDTMMQISADWPGITTATVERSLGQNAVCIFLNGAEGDASPNGVDSEKLDAKVSVYGGRVADKALTGLANLTLNDDIRLAIWTQAITLPPRKPRPEFIVAALTLGASIRQAKEFVTDLMPESAAIMFLRIGPVCLIGFPCEPTADLGLNAKQIARQAGIERPAIVALTNTWMAYALTPEQYKAGEYESMMSFYGDQLGPALLAAVQSGFAATQK